MLVDDKSIGSVD